MRIRGKQARSARISENQSDKGLRWGIIIVAILAIIVMCCSCATVNGIGQDLQHITEPHMEGRAK
jgi:predicted small secreted protein